MEPSSSTAVTAAKPVLPPDFNKYVKHYVHYDTLTKTFQNQTTNARQMKDAYEEKIIGALEVTNMKNAVIQIAGGKIQLVEDTHPAPLNFQHLERMLHDYYRAKGSKFPDETEAILRFIKQNRKQVTVSKLKRDMLSPAIPPPSE